MNPVSIFIMDVTKSTSEDNWDEITNYLSKLVSWINQWTHRVTSAKVKHRLGDEIILISDNYSTAYIIAFYINQIWKFEKQPPYFGLTFGNVDRDISTVDIDTWNHPLIKQAKNASIALKEYENRFPFLFRLPIEMDFTDTKIKIFERCMDLIKVINDLQNDIITSQTEHQRLVCFLSLVIKKQSEIANLLNKTPGTISSHFKKGKSGLVLQSFLELQNTLNFLQKIAYNDSKTDNIDINTKLLNNSIQKHISQHIFEFVDINEILQKRK